MNITKKIDVEIYDLQNALHQKQIERNRILKNEIAKNETLKFMRDNKYWVINNGGRFWFCSEEVKGALVRRLDNEEIDHLKSFVGTFIVKETL